MLQIVHDVAPGASLAFASAFNGLASFAANIQSLAAAGAKVIVDDVIYFAEPLFQDGIIAQAVNNVVSGRCRLFLGGRQPSVATVMKALLEPVMSSRPRRFPVRSSSTAVLRRDRARLRSRRRHRCLPEHHPAAWRRLHHVVSMGLSGFFSERRAGIAQRSRCLCA